MDAWLAFTADPALLEHSRPPSQRARAIAPAEAGRPFVPSPFCLRSAGCDQARVCARDAGAGKLREHRWRRRAEACCLWRHENRRDKLRLLVAQRQRRRLQCAGWRSSDACDVPGLFVGRGGVPSRRSFVRRLDCLRVRRRRRRRRRRADAVLVGRRRCHEGDADACRCKQCCVPSCLPLTPSRRTRVVSSCAGACVCGGAGGEVAVVPSVRALVLSAGGQPHVRRLCPRRLVRRSPKVRFRRATHALRVSRSEAAGHRVRRAGCRRALSFLHSQRRSPPHHRRGRTLTRAHASTRIRAPAPSFVVPDKCVPWRAPYDADVPPRRQGEAGPLRPGQCRPNSRPLAQRRVDLCTGCGRPVPAQMWQG